MEKTIRFFAGLDLLVTGLFVLPLTAQPVLDLIFWLHARFIAPEAAPEIGGAAMAFINIMGVIGVIWALARLKMPLALLARLDGAGRLAVAALLLWHIAGGLSPIFGLFAVTELAGAIFQLRPGFTRSRTA